MRTSDLLTILYYCVGMINQNSLNAVNGSTFSTSFRKPLYDSYCFSNIPGTIEQALTGSTDLPTLPSDTVLVPGKQYDTVVLFFIDAFGWRFFERYQDQFPTLKRFIEQGKVSKITSQFPSTTSAHVTAIHTGQRVDESGVFEWFYYEPQVDDMISPLPFAIAGASW
jgi:Type I phosphodiesterase / nucleotide pyrophosphatase